MSRTARPPLNLHQNQMDAMTLSIKQRLAKTWDQESISPLAIQAPLHCSLNPLYNLSKYHTHVLSWALPQHVSLLPQNTTWVCITWHNEVLPLHLGPRMLTKLTQFRKPKIHKSFSQSYNSHNCWGGEQSSFIGLYEGTHNPATSPNLIDSPSNTWVYLFLWSAISVLSGMNRHWFMSQVESNKIASKQEQSVFDINLLILFSDTLCIPLWQSMNLYQDPVEI